MQIKYLKENEIINLENGKRFTLNNTGKLFLDKYNELGFEIAYKEISALYISSKKMYNWILEDTYIYEEWPDYYYKIKELVCDD